jgi:hypothetical protein
MKLVPNRKYTYAELAELRDSDELAQRAIAGYVWRQDLDGTMQLVHHTQATGGGRTTGGRPERPDRLYVATEDPWGDLPPIVKRTPQERKESLIAKWWDACRAAGTVPGLTDEQVTEIIGEDWKTGKSEMTGEIVERLAAAMLNDAERKAGQ